LVAEAFKRCAPVRAQSVADCPQALISDSAFEGETRSRCAPAQPLTPGVGKYKNLWFGQPGFSVISIRLSKAVVVRCVEDL